MELKLEDCLACAELLDIDPLVIQAVASVEVGSGGLESYLFEPHVFSRLTGRRFDQSNPDVSYPLWDRSKYPRTAQAKQWQFNEAVSLDAMATYKSTSWGLFQIMGYHYSSLNYSSPLSMVTDLRSGVAQNVNAFGRMVRHMGLVETLRDKAWAKFARVYNGPGYKQNLYDIKLATAYEKISSGTVNT